MKKNLLILAIITLFPNTSFAYLDPGLGGVILQSIVGGLAAGIGIISLYWNKFKSIFIKKNKEKQNKIDKSK
tara:strand:- start:85 stop:300 length:216 start_codon:yes stop_codon:yes gene_type:complete